MAEEEKVDIMKLNGGYLGKIARVNLTKGTVGIQEFDSGFARKYLGGVGFASKLIWDEVSASINPLSAGNLLVFATGPYQAAPITGAGKCAVAARSPLTGFWGESLSGGHIGPALKKAGFDAIAISGRRRKPVYIYVHDGEIEILDASSYWGMDTIETVDIINKDLKEDKIAVAAIGQAGEKLVRFANIFTDKHGCFGRTGMGAVMGSKNLKALVVRGTLKPPLNDRDKLLRTYKELLPKMKESDFTKMLREHGTAVVVVPREESSALPMKNRMQGTWKEGAKKIGAPKYTELLKAKPYPCEYCIIGCHRKITADGYPNKGAGPEYVTLAMLGSNLLIDDLESLVIANDFCNRYGIDTVETGALLGWAFESYEKGMITKEDTGGVELTWGNKDALLSMVTKIANRENIGNLIAEGWPACVSKYPETKPFALNVMNMGVAGFDPRAFFSTAISTITSTRGSCYLHGYSPFIEESGITLPELGYDEPPDRFEVAGKGKLGAVFQDIQQFWNSLTFCMFTFGAGMTLTDQIKLLNIITGWDVTPNEARTMGERIVNLQNAFNLKMGLVPERDIVMPKRFTVPHKEGGAAGKVPPWKDILEEYYSTRSWTNGIPTKKKLLELELKDIAKEKP